MPTSEKKLLKNCDKVMCKDLFHVRYGKGLPQKDRDSSGKVPVYGSNGIVGFHDIPLVNYETIIIGRKGSVGKIHFSKTPSYPIDTTFFIEPKKKFEMKYVYDFLKMNEALLEKKDTSTAIPGLRRQEIENLQIPIPSLEVQKIVIKKLSRLEDLWEESLESLTNARRALEQTMIVALHKLIPNDESELPDNWEMVELQEVAEINPKKSEIKNVPDDTEVTFVPMAAVSEHSGAIETPEIRPIGEVRKGYTYFAEGDVLFAKITPCMENGKAAIARNLKNKIGFGTTEFHVIRPSKKLKAEFIYAIVRSQTFRKIAQQNMTGTAGQARVPTEFLKEYQIALPPIEEQEQIIVRLAKIKEQVGIAKHLYNEALIRVKNIQKSLLHKAFSGELLGSQKKKSKEYTFGLIQAVTGIVEAYSKTVVQYGEMITAKYGYLVQSIFKVPLGIEFAKHSFGPYDNDIKKAVATGIRQGYFARNQHKGLILGSKASTITSKSYPILEATRKAMEELMKTFANAKSNKIELLATVCKVIEDSQQSDFEAVKAGMQSWKTPKSEHANKAEKFDEKSIKNCLEYIEKQGWDNILLQNAA